MKALGILPLILLASCTVGPNYKRPEMPTSKKWKEGKATAKTELPDEWWKLFHDSTLNKLVSQSQSSNQDLKGAQARLQTARALVGVKRADWFPQLNLNNSFTAQRGSHSTAYANVPAGSAAAINLEQQHYHSAFELSYEADVWGRIKRGVESAKATMGAAEDALDATRLSIASEVARNYFLLRSLDAQRIVVSDTIKSRNETLELQQTKFNAGLSNESDTTRARTELELAKSDLISVERQRGSAEHALAVLCGEAPANFKVGAYADHSSPPNVPVGLPSDLMKRRPDVRASEQKLMAASADIGVAEAAFYPSFKLLGGGGFESIDAGTFLKWENRILSIGPSISVPIFQGGRNKANYEAAKSRYDEALAEYRQTLLGAFREVEDALLDLKSYAAQRNAVDAAVHSAEDTERLARTRNEKGLTSYFEVVDANRTVLQTKLALAQIEGQRMVATVQLLKAMGGGWNKGGK